MITVQKAATRVLRQLDDETEEVWTRDMVEDWIQDGADRLCRESEILFDMAIYDRQPLVGNHTRDFEVDYMHGMPIFARFNFTRESEREFMEPGAKGPANHTNPDNANFMTVDGEEPAPQQTHTLPNGFTSVSRVTHDWLRLSPESSRWLRGARISYETEQGGTYSYSMDQDGYFELRLVGLPTVTVEPETISGTFGPIRQITSYDMDDETVTGSYGIIRQVPRHFVATSQQYGAMRRMVPDDNATRVEIFRLGARLKNAPFEIPDRAVKYCEWWALHRAFSQPGEGEDPTMAQHYAQRFQMGVDRMKKRVKAILDERTRAMGVRRMGKLDTYLQHFPVGYGYSRPFRG